MSIQFQPEEKTFTLCTRHTAYQIQIGPLGYLLHLYYGRRAEGTFDYLYRPKDCGFSPNPYELRLDRDWSLDLLPQEYSGSNGGDYRLSSLNLVTDSGVWGADLRYVRHAITSGKYTLPSMPSAFARDGEAETLSIVLGDPAAGVEVELLYGVYEARDVITRAVRIANTGSGVLRLEKAASVCLDLPFGTWDLIHFHGRHAMERQVDRSPLSPGIRTVSSRRGASSHQENPFVLLCQHSATEDHGECYGVMPVYSGNHKTEAEVDQMGSVRVVSGIHDQQFSWKLEPGEGFDAPEVLLAYTDQGLTGLSHLYHRFLRQNLCRSSLMNRPRPVLLNNWEATYFQFQEDTILQIAREAKDLGVELLVLDDGWFGQRDDDNRGLGDWYVNTRKLPEGLEGLIAKIHDLGLQFGLWVEPESVNEDSDLYRRHPDWALTVPGRKPTMGRNQLVLDLSRKEVTDWLYATFSEILRRYDIQYIKWDMNRNLADAYSPALPPDRQGEVLHRYMLGLYALLDRLTREFPAVLFEGCSGGGGRFDAGMLAYSPQIWCSDDTDAIERLSIQYGTSFGYPMPAVGAHVSAVPSHQTGRSTPIGTRAVVAMAGTFGYELDLKRLSDDEKNQVRRQIARFHEYDALLRDGDYYRLAVSAENHAFTAWEFAAPDGSEALVSVVLTHPQANPRPLHLRFQGLDELGQYTLRQEVFGNLVPDDLLHMKGRKPQQVYSGAALMYGGYTLPDLFGDYPSAQIYLKRL